MTIFIRDLIHRIVLCLLILFCFQSLPYVTCQKESESADGNIKSVSENSAVAIILLVIFLASMVFCCCFYAFYRGTFQAQEDEVLHNNRARSTGLDKNVIESFPFFLYSEVKGLKIGNGGVECAICLNEFEDEEKLRWMPPCSHTFHANCIDVWLSSRSTCPVCRANLSLKPGESFTYSSVDLEMGISRRDSPEDLSFTENKISDYTTPRSRSTGLFSSWRMAEIIVPRSHSTGHTVVPLGENLDRFTLQLPEELQRQLVSLNKINRSHMDLPRARSSRQGYRSDGIGSEKSGFSQGRQTLRRAISMSLSFSFQNTFVRSTISKDNLVGETSQAEEDNGFGERSFQRLMP